MGYGCSLYLSQGNWEKLSLESDSFSPGTSGVSDPTVEFEASPSGEVAVAKRFGGVVAGSGIRSEHGVQNFTVKFRSYEERTGQPLRHGTETHAVVVDDVEMPMPRGTLAKENVAGVEIEVGDPGFMKLGADLSG